MPRERSIDIDDYLDLKLARYLFKNDKNYLNKFSLKNKKVFVIGGSGLIGSEITEALISASAEVINLDKDKKKSLIMKKKYSSNKYKFFPFDVENMKNLDKNISILFKNLMSRCFN